MLSILAGPNTPGVSASEAMVRAMAEFATARDIGQSMHVAESVDVVAAVERRYGVRGVVRWLAAIGGLERRTLAAHCVHLDDDELRLLAERGVAISHNPVSNLFLGDGIAPIFEALHAGVLVALGTDGAASNNAQDMFEVLKIAPLLQRARRQDGQALGSRPALRMATIDGARALGLERVTGSIEPGKRADILILDLASSPRSVALHDVVSQLVHATASSSVSTVLVDGQMLVENGHLVHEDERALLAEAQAIGASLAARIEAAAA
jgi:5-methylthioadenosine/S-adenosylhomocysteine deaminase